VYGVPLTETEYAHSHARARASSRLPELFSADAGQPPVHLPLQIIEDGVETVSRWLQRCLAGPFQIITADAADERHLDILTQAALPHMGRLLLVGSAGWAERLALACQELLAPAQPGVLVVVGSLNAVAIRQVQAALQAGVTVVQYPTASTSPMISETAQDWQSVTQALVSGRPAILWSHSADLQVASHRGGSRILRALAGIVRDILTTTPVSGLAIVGGDTAQAVLRALHASGLVLAGEMLPGIPYGRLLDGPWAGLLTATKAGGFGSDLALCDCLEFLRRQAAPLSR
jgi:D-threonate/D-erythronate kinase